MMPDGQVIPIFKWSYHYRSTLFASGTHYIVLDSRHDAPDLSSLAPCGYIVANGQAPTYERLKHRILEGCRIVMLHNTGGATQAFASLRRAMLSQDPPPESSQLLDMLELVSPQPWAKQFGLPIRFIGVGEQIDDLRPFTAPDFVAALFGQKP